MRYDINHDFFNIIDTEAKAYFLGLLYADGCVSQNGYNVVISLHEKDDYILYNFANLIFKKDTPQCVSKYTSKQKPHNTYIKLRINSKIINAKLQSFGCIPNKSLFLKFPKNIISEDFMHHFIRGYFDGDGSINFAGKIFTITSTFDFCNSIKNLTNFNLFIYKYKNIFRLTTHNITTINSLHKYLYKNATIYLNRKKLIFDKLYLEYKQKIMGLKKRKSIKLLCKDDIDNIIYLYKTASLTIPQIEAKYNLYAGAVGKILYKNKIKRTHSTSHKMNQKTYSL